MSESNIGGLGVSKNFDPTYTGYGLGITKTEGVFNQITLQSSIDFTEDTVLELDLPTSVYIFAEAYVDSNNTATAANALWEVIDSDDGTVYATETINQGNVANIFTLATLTGAYAAGAPLTLRVTSLVNTQGVGQYTNITIRYFNSVADVV